MCGRFVSASTESELADYFGAVPTTGADGTGAAGEQGGAPALEPSHNVAPTNDVYSVLVLEGMRRLMPLRWGLIPPWARDPKIGNRMINARAETVATKNAYRRPFRVRRCIVPADGFYEWMPVAGQRHKQPVYIHRVDGEPLAFAGLWERRQPPGEELVRSTTIITCPANERIKQVHDRMPVVLPPAAWEPWLDPANEDVAALQGLLVPAPPELFETYPVGREVNNPRNKGAHLLEPVSV